MPTILRGSTPLDVAMPMGHPRGGVVVIQEAFGVNDHIRDVCRRFAAAEYVAVAPHLFWRAGDPVFSYDRGMDEVGTVMATLRAPDLDADVDAAVAEVADRGIDVGRTAVVGFCMGGIVALAAAARLPLAAAVTFYGGGVAQGRFGYRPLLEMAGGLQAAWLGLYGDADQGIPVDQVEALRSAAGAAAVPTRVVRYADAGHGFHCDARASYHQASARDAWQQLLDWLEAHVPATPAVDRHG